MAKESMKARQLKREKLVVKYAEKRKALKAEGDFEGLQKLPRNASPVRYIRMFGRCRNMFRQMASDGKIPGVTKSSW
jgi:small subunit ribosomal protein S14